MPDNESPVPALAVSRLIVAWKFLDGSVGPVLMKALNIEPSEKLVLICIKIDPVRPDVVGQSDRRVEAHATGVDGIAEPEPELSHGIPALEECLQGCVGSYSLRVQRCHLRGRGNRDAGGLVRQVAQPGACRATCICALVNIRHLSIEHMGWGDCARVGELARVAAPFIVGEKKQLVLYNVAAKAAPKLIPVKLRLGCTRFVIEEAVGRKLVAAIEFARRPVPIVRPALRDQLDLRSAAPACIGCRIGGHCPKFLNGINGRLPNGSKSEAPCHIIYVNPVNRDIALVRARSSDGAIPVRTPT